MVPAGWLVESDFTAFFKERVEMLDIYESEVNVHTFLVQGLLSKKSKSNPRKYASLDARRDRLVALDLCYCCLGTGHQAKSYRKKTAKCPHCKRGGHPMVTCVVYIVEQYKKQQDNEPQTSSSKGTFLETFSCYVKTGNNSYTYARGMVHSY